MTSIKTYFPGHLNQTNVIPLAGHAYKGNTFRSPRQRIEGSPVLIGHIHARYEVFAEGEGECDVRS